jgi:superfamily II DNA/RNA helicase
MTIPSEHISAENLTFSEILKDPQLVEGLAKQNIIKPTQVQALTIPKALLGTDLIVQAQTGSGKTLAFMLPILANMGANIKEHVTKALIVTPTRELALQVKAVVESVAPHIVPSCLIGGSSAAQQESQLRKDSRIIVGTPGRLLDFIRQKLVNLKDCQMFVLDEADEMLSMGFVDEVRDILTKLPAKRQGLFFSATITNRVASLAYNFLKNPETVVIEKDLTNQPKIEHLFCKVDGGVTSKAQALCSIFSSFKTQSGIVFCNTKSDTELIVAFLKRRGFDAEKINSDLTQKQRDYILNSLRTGELKYLIATDVAARGIDIKELELVINYSLPKEAEVYTHRTGRTGRAGASGKAISLIGPQDLGMFYGLNKLGNIELKEITLAELEQQAA